MLEYKFMALDFTCEIYSVTCLIRMCFFGGVLQNFMLVNCLNNALKPKTKEEAKHVLRQAATAKNVLSRPPW